MSTYYYMVCYTCKQRCDAGSDAAGGKHALGHSHHLQPFVMDHCGPECRLDLTNEHGDILLSAYSAPYKDAEDPREEWHRERMALIERAQNAEARVRLLEDLYGSPK